MNDIMQSVNGASRPPSKAKRGLRRFDKLPEMPWPASPPVMAPEVPYSRCSFVAGTSARDRKVPSRSAEAVLREFFAVNGRCTLVHQQSEFRVWDAETATFVPYAAERLEALVYRWLSEPGQTWWDGLKVASTTTRKQVGDIVWAIRNMCQVL